MRALVLLLVCLGCERNVAAPRRVEAPPSADVDAREPQERVATRVRLNATGDLVLNPQAMRALLDEGSTGYASLLAGYAASIDEDEIATLNLEQPLVDDLVPLDAGWPRQNPAQQRRAPILGATPALADALRAAGVDIVSVANNHAYDQTREGLSRTLSALEHAEVAAVGAGPSVEAAYAPIVIERNGARVAFLSFSEFFNQRPREREGAVAARLDESIRVQRALERARHEAEIVVVCVHWGRDFEMSPSAFVRRMARELVDAGADVILGTGPHVLHEIERMESGRGEALVAYSLGNIASGMGRTYRIGNRPREDVHPANVRPEAREGLALRFALELTDDVIAIRDIRGVPLWTDNNWLDHVAHDVPHRIRVVPMREVEPALREERMGNVRSAVGSLVVLP